MAQGLEDGWEVGASFDLATRVTSPGHRLVGMGRVGYEAAIGTVGEQVELLKYRLSDQYFIAEDESFFERAPEDVDDNGFGDTNGVLAAIRVFGNSWPRSRTPRLSFTWLGITERTTPGIDQV